MLAYAEQMLAAGISWRCFVLGAVLAFLSLLVVLFLPSDFGHDVQTFFFHSSDF